MRSRVEARPANLCAVRKAYDLCDLRPAVIASRRALFGSILGIKKRGALSRDSPMTSGHFGRQNHRRAEQSKI